jgi:hypothetical protein
MDVKTTFLNGAIEEEVYLNNLKGLRYIPETLTFAD